MLKNFSTIKFPKSLFMRNFHLQVITSDETKCIFLEGYFLDEDLNEFKNCTLCCDLNCAPNIIAEAGIKGESLIRAIEESVVKNEIEELYVDTVEVFNGLLSFNNTTFEVYEARFPSFKETVYRIITTYHKKDQTLQFYDQEEMPEFIKYLDIYSKNRNN
jgi:hypothetical protein